MKYRWTTQIMTRHSGMLTIWCKDRGQAEQNVLVYKNSIINRLTTTPASLQGKLIAFHSASETSNLTLIDEIISISIGDMELSIELARQEALASKRLQAELDFSQENSDEVD